MPIKSIADAATEWGRIKRRWTGFETLIKWTLALVLGVMTTSIWALLNPEDELSQIGLGFLVFALAVLSFKTRSRRPVTMLNLALHLEMTYGHEVPTPLSIINPEETLAPAWVERLEREKSRLLQGEKSRVLALAGSLLIPLVITALTVRGAVPSFKTAMKEVSGVVGRLARGSTLRIVAGSVKGDAEGKTYKLSEKEPITLDLLAQNLLEVQVTDSTTPTSEPQVILLKRLPSDVPVKASSPTSEVGTKDQDQDVFQSFQLSPIRTEASEASVLGVYSIAFAASESVHLFIPSLAGDRPLATLKIHLPPTPRVTLKPAGRLEDPWPDDQPLPLSIEVQADNPIQTVRLIIKSGQRVAKELVANVMAENKMELTAEYRLLLESHVESDLAQVEIVAEATDRAVPLPLVGFSAPIKLNTASAYGRYREALNTLRGLKGFVDDALTKGVLELPPKAKELANMAATQSDRSPFFDGLDRVQIYRFASRVEDHRVSPANEKLLELSGALNEFLFEHEILDDRERDRDFFVAIRSLSRLIEQVPAKRMSQPSLVTERVRKFLDERMQRWTLRVERLGTGGAPAKWGEIRQNRPFHQAMNSVDRLEAGSMTLQVKTAEQLTVLSKIAVEYRSWIDELEAREDQVREEEERKRQEGLANARDVLRELQVRQGEISSGLDRSDVRPRGEIAQEWPNLRLLQNTNVKETKRLESQMRSLSPTAAARIEAAAMAMAEANTAGDEEDFPRAESASDLAGRLLRQAESAAQDSQQKKRQRGRRRQVTGDSYYGQSVVGGDIEIRREYQVDRRYREDILDEVQSTSYDEENRTLLENYLRHVVR